MRSCAGRLFNWASPVISTYGYQVLFMPISAEAVRAALASVSDSAPLKASISNWLRAANAADSAAPRASSGARVERAITASRFRRMSLAQSGS
ncbi:Uncharacterised protein [Bordetella pertussis]|nr:Uncharacterised protein [Bordetella pertussis]CFN74662.1 Uncharacterised protein [Bordetella pertussis]CFP68113.1 Uncharacterised protein [Bordetella pertussis]CFU00711.1 Uncharacterised protein [Bordetella pertussis]